MDNTCRFCTWWVEETGDYQDFQHYQAVKGNKRRIYGSIWTLLQKHV